METLTPLCLLRQRAPQSDVLPLRPSVTALCRFLKTAIMSKQGLLSDDPQQYLGHLMQHEDRIHLFSFPSVLYECLIL